VQKSLRTTALSFCFHKTHAFARDALAIASLDHWAPETNGLTRRSTSFEW